jgi:non-ribosomal peptide synthetase component F
MTLADLFETGTVAALAERLRARATERRPETRGLPAAPKRDRYPVAWEQLAVLRAEQAADMGTAYNLPSGLELPEDLDEARLRSAADALVGRHEILRTRFRRPDSGDCDPEMEILPPAPAAIEDAELPPGAEPLEAMREWIRPFDLWAGPPVRWILARAAGRPRVLLLDVHHALADAFTMEMLLGELAALYAGTAGAAPIAQLKDYAWWSRQGSGAAASDEARAYWLERFRGPLPSLDLPADRPRPATHTWQADTLEFEISPETLGRLRACAAERRTTPFTVVVSAWAALLARYARTDEVVMAAPVDSREASGAAGMAGMMVSLAPLRLAVRPEDTVAGLIERAHSVHAEAQRHRTYGVARLLEDLAPPAAPDRALLADVSLSYMNFAEAGQPAASGFRLCSLPRRHGKGDLAIFVRDLPGRMTMTIEYYAAIFDRDRIERMACHLTRLLGAMTASAAGRPVASLPLADAEESQWLAAAGEGTRTTLPLDRGLFGALADRAAAAPDAIALEGAGLRLSYRELVGRASGIAARLRAAGISPGNRVGLHVERDANAVILLLGAVAAGAVYVPFDPAWPAERAARILDDSDCAAVIADRAGREALPAGARVLDAAGLLEAKPAGFAAPPAGGAAYVMYTSGSTGAPKGVVVNQAGILRLALGGGDVAITPEDCVLQSGPLAFDASTYEIWGALLNGARLAVATREEVLDPDSLAAACGRHGATVLWLTTALFNRQVDCAPESFRGLRLVLTGGEVLSVSHAARALRAAPDTVFLNCYGPTENTTFTTVRRLVAADVAAGPAPIGHPIAHTRVAVLEERGAGAGRSMGRDRRRGTGVG